MVLEAIMFCLDNSEWMRNGDYSPSRMQAQIECAAYIASIKVQHNPETAVGVLSLAGKRIDVHLTPTREVGDLLRAMDEVKIEGSSNFLSGLKTAHLALKNRQNKNQKQRIILFVGSPVSTDSKEFVKLGKMLKKNSVALDIIHFGFENSANDNSEKLEALITAINTQDNSHLVNIPPGLSVQLSDVVQTTAILQESGGGSAAAPAPAVAQPFGAAVDANLDPELAMALRESMEEEKARQQARATAAPASAAPSSSSAASAAAAPVPMEAEEDDDALLQQALALSLDQGGDEDMADAKPTPAQSSSNASSTAVSTSSSSVSTSSSSGAGAGAGAGSAAPPEADLEPLQDPDFIQNLLADVGLSKSDVEFADILSSMSDKSKPGDKDKDKDKDADKGTGDTK